MHFLITNVTGFRNKGCEAMTKVIIAELAKLFPSARFAVFSNDPAYDELYAPTNVEVTFSLAPAQDQDLLVKFYRSIKETITRCNGSAKSTRQLFSWAQVVFSSGGDVFSSEYDGLKRHLVPIQIATRLRKPCILLGHSIGPFKTHEERKVFMRAMQDVPLITTRENLSLQYVREMNLKNTRVELTADPAFCFQGADKETVDRMWEGYQLPHDSPVLGLAISQGIAFYAKTSYKTHFEAITKLTHYATKELGFHVVLIPHVYERYVNNDDRIICTQVYRALGFPRDVSLITMDHSAEEIKGIIGRCKLVVAERIHAAIASLSQAVPTLVVGYSVKARGILRDIFGSQAEQDYLIPIDLVTDQLLKSHVKKLWEQRDDIVHHLTSTIPSIQDRAKYNFSLVQELLQK